MTASLAEQGPQTSATYGPVPQFGSPPPAAVAMFGRVADVFEAGIEDLALQQALAVESGFPSYANGVVPRESLLASGRRNVNYMVEALRMGAAPDPTDLDEVARVAERTVQGVPAGELHSAYRTCLLLLADHFARTAREMGLDADVILSGTRLLWETADVLASVVVTARQSAELDVAREDESQRGDFLRALVLDSPRHAELVRRAPAYGLPQERLYWVIRARSDQTAQGDEIRAHLESQTRTLGCSPLLGVIEGDIVGVVPTRPKASVTTMCAGVDGPVTLEQVPHAFATASRMLDVALGFGMTGIFDLAGLGLRVPVASEPELGKMLTDRYLLPLRKAGEFGEVLEQTLTAYVAAGGNIKSTASALGVHPNTVRHRLRRIEDITGAFFDDLDSLIELWWAVSWRAHERDDAR
jgi:hypothetical protein